MQIRTITARTILTRQKQGFLAVGSYPFTHTLSWAAGCGFGNLYCGAYCYAQALPNWLYNRAEGESWGDAIILKENAPDLLAAELGKAKSRKHMRIFMSSVTDPYQPLERRLRITRRCLEVFARYDDLDLLMIQTRSPLVVDDLERIAAIPYCWLSMTLETDRGDLPYGPNVSFIQQRLDAVRSAVAAGVRVQIAVSPCLPYTEHFAECLIETGAARIVIDTFVAGDGSKGERTSSSPFAALARYDWRDQNPAQHLYRALLERGVNAHWSAEGFSNIPPRYGDSID